MKTKTPHVCLAVGLAVASVPVFAGDQYSYSTNSADSSNAVNSASNNNAGERTYTGTLVSINPQAHTLDARNLLLSRQFTLGDRCAYVLPDNTQGDFNQLRTGERIQISYQEANGVRAADRIEVVPMHYEGMVKAIDPAQHTLTLHADGFNKDLQIAADCKVVLRNEKGGALTDLQPGEHVRVTYETPGDQATAWRIEQTSQTFSGELVAFDTTDHTLKAREGFSSKEFTMGANCAIVVNGKTDGKVSDLRPDERLVFNYDEVNGVNVVNRIAPLADRSGKGVNNPANTGMGAPGMGY